MRRATAATRRRKRKCRPSGTLCGPCACSYEVKLGEGLLEGGDGRCSASADAAYRRRGLCSHPRPSPAWAAPIIVASERELRATRRSIRNMDLLYRKKKPGRRPSCDRPCGAYFLASSAFLALLALPTHFGVLIGLAFLVDLAFFCAFASAWPFGASFGAWA